MKRWTVVLIALALVFYLSGAFAWAQRGGGPPSRPSAATGRGASASSSHDTSTPSGGKKSVSDLLKQNTKLSDKLEKLLGVNSLTALQADADGFKNLGLFVAACHVSHNLGIPFDQLKSKMMGSDSLGSAIQALDPKANAKAEVSKAKKQADNDLKTSS